jgi:hypothetical protein
MTLKDKFKKIDIKLSKNNSTKIVDREADIMETIADDYAIEFFYYTMDYCVEFYDNNEKGNIYKFSNHDNKYTTKELLEMFKKEKGL